MALPEVVSVSATQTPMWIMTLLDENHNLICTVMDAGKGQGKCRGLKRPQGTPVAAWQQHAGYC